MPRRRKRFTSSKYAQRRRKAAYAKTIFITFALVLFIGAVAWLSRLEDIRIAAVEVEGNSIITNEELVSIVDERLQGTYFFLIPRSNTLLYPRRDITAAVLSSFPRLVTAEVSFIDFQSIILSVEERVPYARWCGDDLTLLEVEDNRCYFLDADGFIFAKSPGFTGNVFMNFYGSIDSNNPVGAQFLSRQEFRNIVFFLNSLKRLSIDPAMLIISNDIDLELFLDSGTRIILRRNNDFADILTNLKSIFASEVFRDINMLTVDYIDLRFGRKVYYKFVE